MSKILLSFGHGYCAQALASLLLPQGWRIIGTTRDQDKAVKIRETGVEALVWPPGDCAQALAEATHLLISAGPTETGDPVLLAHGAQIARRAPRLEWVGYLSTTSVYGDHAGAWVDENTPLDPALARGHGRAATEAAWSSVADLPLHIFRLAGIYGPGRGPFAKVRNGTARRIIKQDQVFSRTHVDDIAQVLAASIERPNPGAIYNVCDNEPAPPQDVIAHAAGLLGLPIPPAVAFEEADLPPMALSFYSENRRVRNNRIKDELAVKLLYPGYREGLAGILREESA